MPISDEVSDLVLKLGNFYAEVGGEDAEENEVDRRPFTRPFANHAGIFQYQKSAIISPYLKAHQRKKLQSNPLRALLLKWDVILLLILFERLHFFTEWAFLMCLFITRWAGQAISETGNGRQVFCVCSRLRAERLLLVVPECRLCTFFIFFYDLIKLLSLAFHLTVKDIVLGWIQRNSNALQ